MGYSCQKCKKIGGTPNSFRRYDVQKITQNLRNLASLLHTDKVPVCAKSSNKNCIEVQKEEEKFCVVCSLPP